MRRPNAYNTRSGVLLQGTSEYYFTYDEAEEKQDLDFVITNPTNDFTNVILAELDVQVNVNDRVRLYDNTLVTVIGYSRKPIRNRRRANVVYEYRLVLK